MKITEQESRQLRLDAFILRAGFRYGWLNLESWARRMAEQAVEELSQRHQYHPCTGILIQGLKNLPGGEKVLAEWDAARAKVDQRGKL